MILDRLDRAERWQALHPRFKKAFDFLRQGAWEGLSPGRYPVEGDLVYALVGDDQGRGREASPLEAHREYIDIQYVVAGDEWIGWHAADEQLRIRDAYDPARDIMFFNDLPASWVRIPPGCFALLFPEDAHAPLAGAGRVRKVVLKIKASVTKCTSE